MANRHRPNLGNRFLKHLLLWATGIFLAGCENGKVVYHDYHSFHKEEWAQHDHIDFQIKIPDSSATYTLFIEVRNNNRYPYCNLPFSICRVESGSSMQHADTLSIPLTDRRKHWFSNGLGRLYQIEFHAGTLTFSHSGENCIVLKHLLPDTLLKGISDIGIRIERE